jgi:hypothetical protein
MNVRVGMRVVKRCVFVQEGVRVAPKAQHIICITGRFKSNGS